MLLLLLVLLSLLLLLLLILLLLLLLLLLHQDRHMRTPSRCWLYRPQGANVAHESSDVGVKYNMFLASPFFVVSLPTHLDLQNQTTTTTTTTTTSTTTTSTTTTTTTTRRRTTKNGDATHVSHQRQNSSF
ncbi:unnamed protein product [Polarella glacialis]|uniref:Uncharacterized protein n=1 Tax=Polarella glacialis TaxID=89957 RepID=A0A813JS70_POLGL|nr:unnamed protein product [Polarella glacialis]